MYPKQNRKLTSNGLLLALLLTLGLCADAQAQGFIYALQDVDGESQIYGFVVNETTGALSALPGFPLGTGGNGDPITLSERLTIDQVNGRLYVLNDGSNTVSAFSINPATGALTPLPFSPINLGGSNWYTVVVHPSGSPLVVGGGGPNVRSFQLTATTATLAPGSFFNLGGEGYTNLAFSQNGNFLYGGETAGSFSGASVNAATGELTALPGSPFFSGGQIPIAYATDSSGRLFLANFFADQVRVFTTASGIPAAVSGNPFTAGFDSGVHGVLHPNGFYLVASRTNQVGVYRISGSGAATTLSAVTGSPFATGGDRSSTLALSREGRFLFVANARSRNLTTFCVNASTGTLRALNIQPVDSLGASGGVTGMGYYLPPNSPPLPPNNAPTITALPQTVAPGAAQNLQLATVSDAEVTPNLLLVSVTSPNPANGVTLSNLTVDATGIVRADVSVVADSPCGGALAAFELKVTDSCCLFATTTETLTVPPRLVAINSPAPPNGQAGAVYMHIFTQTGAFSNAATFTVSEGVLPTGLLLATGGLLSGTPQQAGMFSFTVKAQDSLGCFGTQLINLTITCPTINVSVPSTTASTAGVAFNQTFTQTGGIGTTMFSTLSTLPNGLTLSSNGVLSGTPVQIGTFPLVVKATDVNGCMGTGNYVLVVRCPTLTLAPAALPGGLIGAAYGQNLTVTPAGGDYLVEVTAGALPTGLNLLPSGVFTGTPSQVGTFNFTVTARGFGAMCSVSQNYTVVITCPSITLAALPHATAGSLFNILLTASPAGGNYQFSSADKPAWLTLTSNGNLSGTPLTAGTFNFNVSVTGFGICTQTLPLTLTVNCPALTLTPATLLNGVAGTAYNQTLAASPAGGNYNYAVTTNTLPAGLTLNAATGALTGTPTAGGNYAFAVMVTGWGTCAKTQSYNLLVTGTCTAITVNPASLPGATVGMVYSQTISANPAGNYTFAVTQGALPPGLTLDANTGALTGTATQGGSYSFHLTATGAGGCTGSRNYVVTVSCGMLTFTPATLPNGIRGAAYHQQLSVNAATTTTLSLLLGSLPPGFTLSSAGLLSGTTNQTGTYNFTVKALAGTCQGTKAYTLVIGNGSTALALSGDYDGDGKSDPALWSAKDGIWRIVRSSDGQAVNQRWGTAGDVTLLGDYDGDGKSDLTVFRPADATFYVKRSSDGGTFVKAWGLNSDIPVPGDYDGDGKTDIAVWRGTNGTWYILQSSDGQYVAQAWGAGYAHYQDVPVAGDYDGDGKSDLAVFRRGNGNWLIKGSRAGQYLSKAWGLWTDVPVANDYDGDGQTDIAVWRPADGTWYIWQSATNDSRVSAWGTAGDLATPGDFDGDGRADQVVWRASATTWFVLFSQANGGNAVRLVVQGQAADQPPGARPR